ncbi:MAG TPA: hypothetical protein VK421_00880 [Pyrinomonadaceae bacterium]|nr:hypothetical protein [Pyrinomonadaceae bacterium]
MNREQSSRRRRLPIYLAFLVAVLSLGVLNVTAVRAQDEAETPAATPAPTPDEEMRKETLRKAKAEADKMEHEADKMGTEARKAKLDAAFPAPSATALEGKTTVEGAVIESQMVSYVSMARAANRIIEAINARFIQDRKTISSIAIYNERDVSLLLSYRTARSQVEITRKGYCDILTPAATGTLCPASPQPSAGGEAVAPAIAPLLAARSFLGAFIDATSLLRTNVEIKGQTFVIDEGPLVAEVFRAARRPTIGLPSTVNLYYPHVFSPNVNLGQGSTILAELERVRTLRVAGEKLAADLAEAEKALEEAKGNIKQLTAQLNEALPRRRNEAVTASANIIKANCRTLVNDVNAVMSLPEKPIQATAMLNLIARISDTDACPGMPAEKLEQMLSLRDVINDTVGRLAKAIQDKTNAETEEARLKVVITTLTAKLNPAFAPGDALAQLKALNAQFDNLVKALVQVDANGVNPLTNFIRTESLLSALPAEGSYWLQLKVINAGGNNRIKTNLLVDIFTGGNRVSHSGGAIVQYNLFDGNGKSIVSDTIADYTNYIKADKVRRVTNSKSDTTLPTPISIDENR